LLAKSWCFAALALVVALLLAGGWLWPEDEPPEAAPRPGPAAAETTATDARRGLLGMNLVIATEAMLFVMLFFSYFYLVGLRPPDPPPGLHYALPMLGVLVASSGVILLGERRVLRGQNGWARVALALTLGLGAVFLGLTYLEYREHFETLTPQTDAYGSIFFTITSFHALHVCVGLSLLLYVMFLPWIGVGPRPPHQAFKVAARYWHFVDVVWIVVVAVLYLLPRVQA
jgi:heme/copper-type cytochrome/quinol oxidase subunit 3